MASFCATVVAGGVLLNPDFGIMRTNQNMRKLHKLLGRMDIILVWAACASGFVKLQPDITVQLCLLPPVLFADSFFRFFSEKPFGRCWVG